MKIQISHLFDYGEVSQARFDLFRRVWAVCVAVQLSLTWRLWTPQTVYPQVPLVQIANAAPRWSEWLLLAVMIHAVGTLILARHSRCVRRASAAFVGALIVMFLIDQHRLQPWAYEFAIIGCVVATCRGTFAFRLLRMVTISVYIFSALGKFDYEFIHTTGQQFLDVSARIAGLDAHMWSERFRNQIVILFPSMELLVAICLCWQPSRRCGVILASLFHMAILLVLGPWGLGHQPAVLMWNLFFIAKVVILFGPKTKMEQTVADYNGDEHRWQRWVAVGVLALVLWPMTEPWGYVDHWLAWGLYSPRNSRATVLVSVATEIPDELAPFIKPGRNQMVFGFREFDIAKWSISTLSVPIYPQDRFQIGVALALGERLDVNNSFRIVREGMASRHNGERVTTFFSQTDRLNMVAQSFFFNAMPRAILDAD